MSPRRTTADAAPSAPTGYALRFAEGWGTRRGLYGWLHFFRNGSSLCGRWQMHGLLWDTGRPGDPHCHECLKVRARELRRPQ